jgi:hypothetical protein
MDFSLSLHHLILILAMGFGSQNEDRFAWQVTEDFSDELKSVG